MHQMLKRKDRVVDAVFFALRYGLLSFGLVAAYIGTNHWTML